MAKYVPDVWNAWILSLLFLVLVISMVGRKKDVIGRMSDMEGYTVAEKLFTVSASLSPYPFMIATIWTPFTAGMWLLCLGLLIYALGMALLAASIKVIIETPPEEPFTTGPYCLSRNPMYVSAMTVLAGICLATASLVLTGYLAIIVFLHHFMVLAEERTCRLKYGDSFEAYLKRIPRYLIWSNTK